VLEPVWTFWKTDKSFGHHLAHSLAWWLEINKISAAKSAAQTTGNIYRVSQEECARLQESVPYVKLYRYNQKHLYPKLNGYGDNGQRSLKL